MSQQEAEFWCRLPLDLEGVFARFQRGFPTADYDHDAENVWEWFDGKTADGLVGFNISRPWDENAIDEPVRFSLLVDDSLTLDDVGHRLSAALRCDVHTGVVRYVRGNEFEFETKCVFRPPD